MTLVLLGCGGGAGETTTTIDAGVSATTTLRSGAGETSTTLSLGGDATTTVPEVTTTADDGSGVGIEDIPAECVAMISEVLNAFEPAVEGIDWDTATIDDHLQVMMSLASVSIGDTTGCEDVQLDVTNEREALCSWRSLSRRLQEQWPTSRRSSTSTRLSMEGSRAGIVRPI